MSQPDPSSSTASPPPDRLAFREIYRRFGRLAVLTGVSGEVSSGEALRVTGANGSGKSTLMRILAGLMAAEAGEITYRERGRPLSLGERRRAIGYLAPDLAFYDELSAVENLRFFARLRGLEPERGDEAIARVGLPPGRMAGALSSGMRQRLRWAWALLARPRLLLLDEPFQNLDAPGIELGQSLLAEHLDRGGLAVVANPSHLELPHGGSSLHLS